MCTDKYWISHYGNPNYEEASKWCSCTASKERESMVRQYNSIKASFHVSDGLGIGLEVACP